MNSHQAVRDAELALILEFAKRKPSVADQERFYALLQALIVAAAERDAPPIAHETNERETTRAS